MNILLATDGSECARRAAKYVATHMADLAKVPRLHVLNVHPPLPYRRAATVLGRKALDDYYASEARKALAATTRVLDKAGIAYEASFRVADIVEGIARYAKSARIDLIVMGSRGHGALAGLALGSVTAKVLASLPTPVLIVR